MFFDFLPTDRERVAFRHVLRADCEVVRERDFRLIGRRTLDVSATGLLIASELDVAVDEPVVLSLRAPSGRYVDAEGVIARVVRGKRKTDRGAAVGVRLSSIDRASFNVLRTTLRRLPPVRAQRPARIDYAALTRVVSMLRPA